MRVRSPAVRISSESRCKLRFSGFESSLSVSVEALLARLTELFLVAANMSACPPVLIVCRARLIAGFAVCFSIFWAPPSLNWISVWFSTPSRSVTGRHSVVMESALSHSAASCAFLTVALRARSCAFGLICISLARTTSSVGPRSLSLRRWTSSAMTRVVSFIHLVLWRSRLSAFSLVVIMMS